METYRPLMMCTDPTSAPHVFVDALVSYFSDQQLSTVGGMVIIAQAMGGRIYSLAPAMGLKGELRVELEGSRFVVVNDTTKQRIPLQYPSELVRTPGRLLVFNDFRDLVQAERERLTQTRKRLAGEVHSRNHGAENGHQDRS